MTNKFHPSHSARTFDTERTVELGALLRGLWAGRWLVAAVASAFFVLGFAYVTWFAAPKYQTRTQIALQARDQTVVNLDSVISGMSTERTAINTELEVIKSRVLLERLAEDLGLENDPEFTAAAGEGADKDTLRAAVLDHLRRTISVSSQRDTFLINIDVTSRNAVKSARIANHLAELYLADQVQTKFAATEYAVDWLSARVAELELELNAKEDAIKDLREETDLISLEALEALNIRAKDVRDRLAEARVAKTEAEADLFLIDKAMQGLDQDGVSDLLSELTGRTSAASDPVAALEAERARLDVILNRTESRINVLEASHGSLQAEVDRQNADLITLNKLRREADATRVLYETFLARLKETTVQIGLHQADGRVLSAALPGHKIAPNEPLVLILSIIVGFVAGVGVLIARSLVHDGFRDAAELERITGVNVVGRLPKMPIHSRTQLRDYLKDKPTSLSAEAIRNLRTAVLLSDLDNPPKIIQVTSANPGDGKTTAAIGLAANLAALGKNVLLIEADIRRRTFSDYFGAMPTSGIVSVVSGETDIKDAIVKDQLFDLDILGGDKTPMNPADFFSSQKFRDFISEVRDIYDYIIVDSPPVNAVTDARIIAQTVDTVLFVVHAHNSNRTDILSGLHELELVNVPATALVLTQMKVGPDGPYGYGSMRTRRSDLNGYYES